MAAVTWRFSMLGLFGVVAVAALACAALTNPTPLWACIVETGVVATLTYAVVAAVFRREARRAFWIGLSMVGWGYALLVAGRNVLDSSISWSGYGNYGSIGFATGQSSLATTRLVLWWAERREGAPWGAYPPPAAAPTYYSTPVLLPSVSDEPDGTIPTGSSSPQEPTLAPPHVVESESQAPAVPGNAVVPTTVPTVIAPAVASPMPSLAAISYDSQRYARLIRIGEYLWALLLGIVGGCLARWMYASHRTIPAAIS